RGDRPHERFRPRPPRHPNDRSLHRRGNPCLPAQRQTSGRDGGRADDLDLHHWPVVVYFRRRHPVRLPPSAAAAEVPHLWNSPGMDESERLERQRFLGLTEADAAHVRRLRETFAAHAREFAESFYRHLLADERTAAFLTDPVQLARLKDLQAAYFAELLEGKFDQSYFEKRLAVGHTHQRVGLEPVFYLGAYNQYVQLTFPLFARALGNDLEKALPPLLSLIKVIFLDVGLALDTYFQAATEQLQQRNEELQQALGLYVQAQRREEG